MMIQKKRKPEDPPFGNARGGVDVIKPKGENGAPKDRKQNAGGRDKAFHSYTPPSKGQGVGL